METDPKNTTSTREESNAEDARARVTKTKRADPVLLGVLRGTTPNVPGAPDQKTGRSRSCREHYLEPQPP